jgi:hypothetical protein
VGLGCAVAVLIAIGCDAGDGGAQSDAATESPGVAACLAAGGQCRSVGTPCGRATLRGNCGSNAFCCLNLVDASCPDGGIVASDYVQTCTAWNDCVAIAESRTCDLCELNCTNAAINESDFPRYMSNSIALVSRAGEECPSRCAGPGGLCCIGGTCQVGDHCFATVSAPDAGPTDAGAEASRDAVAE